MKALIPFGILGLIAAWVLFPPMEKASASGWSSKTPLVGHYFYAVNESTNDGSSTADTLRIRFPRPNLDISDGHSVGSADSSTSVKYVFMTRDTGSAFGSWKLVVYSRSTQDGSAGSGTDIRLPSSVADLTLPGFARGIDSLYVIDQTAATVYYTFWGMN